MSDRVATNVQVAQEHRRVVHFYNVSDGTGESAVVKIDKSALNLPVDKPIKINRIYGVALGMSVNIFFEATADDLILTIPDGNYVDLCFREFGGLKDPQSSGYTGDVVFTTVGHASGDTYSIVIDFTW